MAGLRSRGRKLSFDVLTTTTSFFDDDDDEILIHRSSSGFPIHTNEDVPTNKTNRRKRRNKGSKKKKKAKDEFDLNCGDCNHVTTRGSHGCVEPTTTDVVYREVVVPPEEESVCTVISSVRGTPELRQRSSNVANGGCDLLKVFWIDEDVKEGKARSSMSTSATSTEMGSELMMKKSADMNVNGYGHIVRKMEKDESSDWKQVIVKEDPNHKFSLETSPVKYFMEEMYSGNSLRTTTSLADEKEPERVYDTIFRMPWCCELVMYLSRRSSKGS